jgi:predicted ATPase/class 3 adenylate cyclase
MAELPSGTVTFLFTDIEGSTRLWEQHPQAMPDALVRHDAIVRTTTVAHEGVVFRTVGDAFCIAFATAPAACAAALDAQRALTCEAWGVVDAIPVRMALHTCAAVPEDGDYRTGSLNRLGRLLSAVHGGQIVLSQTTANLARETLPPEVALRDLGERQLRDLRPEPVFQLVAPDLPSAFPPLKTLDRPAHNLPIQPTALIGREQAIVTICAMVRRTDVRHVTLTGPGGTGKTRLGLQVAAELLADFEDGVYFVNLAPLSNPDLVVATIAQALDVQERGGQPLIERLNEYLHGKHLLLVLDNFEQVVEAAPLVGALLAAAPHLKALVTSREPLHLTGEHEYAVPPLLLPDPHHLPPLDRLAEYEAVQLFLARAQAVKADFVITNESAPAIAVICQRLDGLPLAIELAAARVKLLPTQALLARLDQTLKLLTGGARDAPTRQRTMRATIDWSYHILDAGEQTLFARLGVFVGGCTLEAAEAVCNADGDLSMDVLDGMAALVDKSLLKQEEGVAGEPRFTMLETLHAYALERLELSGQAEAVCQQHAQYYLALVERAEHKFRGPEARTWMDRLEYDYENLRAALNWSQATSDRAEYGVRLASALWWFWDQRSVVEGETWLNHVLSHPDETIRLAVRAKALTAASHFAMMRSNPDQALVLAQEALAHAQEAGDRTRIAWALYQIGEVLRFRDDIPGGILALEESLALFRTDGDTFGIARTLFVLGQAVFRREDVVRAIAFEEESLVLFRRLGDKSGIADPLSQLGHMARHQGDRPRAVACYEESLALYREAEDRWGIAWGLGNLAMSEYDQGNLAHAVVLLTESIEIFRNQGLNAAVAWGYTSLGDIERRRGDDARAAAYYDESLALFQELEDEFGLAQVRYNLGLLAHRQHNASRAMALFTESLRSFQRLGARADLADVFAGLAAMAGERGLAVRAARLFGAAEALCENADTPLPPVQRADYDRDVAAVHAQLEEATLAAAWDEGRAMALEEAIAYALAEDA